MSVFKNVSGGDLELLVDGRRYEAASGDTVSIPDEFDYQLEQQPAWDLSKAKKSAEPEPASVEAVASSEGSL